MTKLGPGELFHREITQTKPLEAGLRKMGDAQQLRGAGWQGHGEEGGERGVAEMEMERRGEGRLGKAPSD